MPDSSIQFEQFFFARPLPPTAMIGVVVAVVALSVYLYRRSWGLKPWLRVVLAAARIVVLSLVIATLLEPMVVVEETLVQKRGLPVLIDASASMAMRDQRKRPEDLVEAAVALDMLSAKC